MMKNLFFLITFIFYKIALGCNVQLPERMLLISDNPEQTNLFDHIECEKETIDSLKETIHSIDGKITNTQLTDLLLSKGYKTSIQPSLIEVEHLKKIIREKLTTPPNIFIENFDFKNQEGYLSLKNFDQLILSCTPCHFSSQEFINLKILSANGSEVSHKFSADFKKTIKAYRFKKFHHAFSDVDPSSLEPTTASETPYTEVFHNLEQIMFYKTNKPIKPGELLRVSDLSPINIVRGGSKIDVIIENNLIRIKTNGISRGNGGIGQIVEIFQPDQNKKYQAKVIDFNKVLVEL